MTPYQRKHFSPSNTYTVHMYTKGEREKSISYIKNNVPSQMTPSLKWPGVVGGIPPTGHLRGIILIQYIRIMPKKICLLGSFTLCHHQWFIIRQNMTFLFIFHLHVSWYLHAQLAPSQMIWCISKHSHRHNWIFLTVSYVHMCTHTHTYTHTHKTTILLLSYWF
jgi:hypothetical protein